MTFIAVLEVLKLMPAEESRDAPEPQYARLFPWMEAPAAAAVGGLAALFLAGLLLALLALDATNLFAGGKLLLHNFQAIFHANPTVARAQNV